jgi:hypothetical protein
MSLLGPSEERSMNKDFFDFLRFNPVAEFEMENIPLVPFKLRDLQSSPLISPT